MNVLTRHRLLPALVFLAHGCPTLLGDPLDAEETHLGFESLFDGKSFTRWEQKGNWVIEGGAMWHRDKGGDPTFTA